VSSTNNEDKVSMPPNDCIMLIHNVIFFTTARQFREFLMLRHIKIDYILE
jgi:hypothetical protein